MNPRARMLLASLAGLVLVATPSACTNEPTAAGFWTGAIDLPGQPLQIMIDIDKGAGTWKASFHAPAQGIRGAEMTGVEIAGRSVSFRIPRSQGEPTFRGELSADGQTISGEFSQSGEVTPFRLTRSERPADLDVDIYAEYREPGVAGQGLEGTWRALLLTGPNRMRLALTVWSGEDGALAGSMDSLDQGNLSMSVDGFSVRDDSVWFQMLAVGAEYEGNMKPDGSEIYGLWRQNGREFPLTFRRTGP